MGTKKGRKKKDKKKRACFLKFFLLVSVFKAGALMQ